MNIFFARAGEIDFGVFIKYMIKQYSQSSHIIIMEDDNEFEELEQDSQLSCFFSRGYLESENFLENDFHKMATPIDASLLDSMSQYEYQVMEIASRTNWSNRSYSTRKAVYHQSLCFWNYVLEKNKIDMFLSHPYPHTFHELIVYYLCKIKAIPTILLIKVGLRHIENYYWITSDIYEGFNCLKKYEDDNVELSDDFNSVYEEYVNKSLDIIPEYMKETYSYNKHWLNMPNNASGVLQIKFWLLFTYQLLFQSRNRAIIEKLKKVMETRDLLNQDIMAFNYYDSNLSCVNINDKYIYIPLHAQPEETTVPAAARYEYQILMVKMISACLPEGYCIYLKEHPSQRIRYKMYPFYRTTEFYEEMIKLGNVKFISVDESSHNLIRNCVAVGTVSGTVGFEALCKSKQCLIFANVFYQYAEGVHRIKTLEDCRKSINTIIYGDKWVMDKWKMKLYLMALSQNCIKIENEELKNFVLKKFKEVRQL